MTVTRLDPLTTLIVVDLQQGMMGLPFAHPIIGMVARVAALAAAFRRVDLPVILVNTDGAAPGRRERPPVGMGRSGDATALSPALQAQAKDHRVTKRTPGAFTGTGLEDYLSTLGATQVVLAGVVTGTGVEMTARQAYELGFNVTAAIDAMTDTDDAVHRNSVERILPRIGETGTCADITALLR